MNVMTLDFGVIRLSVSGLILSGLTVLFFVMVV